MFILSEVEYATYLIYQQSFFNGRLPIRYQTGQSLLVLELIRQYSICTIKNIKKCLSKTLHAFLIFKILSNLNVLVYHSRGRKSRFIVDWFLSKLYKLMLNIVCFKPSLKVKDIQKRKNMFLTRQFKVEFKTYIY